MVLAARITRGWWKDGNAIGGAPGLLIAARGVHRRIPHHQTPRLTVIHGPCPKRLAPRITVLILLVQVIAGCAVAVNEPVAEPFNTDVFGANRATTAGVYVRVVNVGTALCIAGATRSGWHFVYDAGGEGQACLRAVREIVGKNAIDLPIISHSDVEHMRGVPALLREFAVRELWWTAYRRPQPSFRKTRRAIDDAAAGGTRVRSLRADGLSPGTVFERGRRG